MNILFIEPCCTKTYSYFMDLPSQLLRVSNCFLYRKVCNDIGAVLQSCPFPPEAIVFGMGWFRFKIFGEVKGLKNLGIPILCQLSKHEVDLEKKLKFCRINKIDAILTSIPKVDYYRKKTGIPTYLFKHAADPQIFKSRNLEKKYDFGFSGALHDSSSYAKGAYQTKDLRRRVQELLSSRKDLNCFLNGSDLIEPRIVSFEAYVKKINQSKIWLSTTCSFGDVPPRYYEVAMSNTLIFTNPLVKPYQDTFRDGNNCVYFPEDLSDFLDKLYFYLENKEERRRIVDTAYMEFHNKHTWKHRAEQLISIVEEVQCQKIC